MTYERPGVERREGKEALWAAATAMGRSAEVWGSARPEQSKGA